MAVLIDFTCKVCRQRKQEARGNKEIYYHVCNDCQRCSKEIEKLRYLEHLRSLSIEERIQKIEEWIYDYNHR